MKTIKTFLKWIYGIGFSFFGLFALSNTTAGGILFISTGLLLIPPVKRRIEGQLNRAIGNMPLIMMLSAALILFSISQVEEQEALRLKDEKDFALLPKSSQDSILAIRGYNDSIKNAQEIINQELEKKEEREELIKKQFHPYDGSHIKLEEYIKENMNDPDTYEHVQTTYKEYIDHLLVVTKFRGTNSFGGVVTNSIGAKVTLKGDIVEIVE